MTTASFYPEKHIAAIKIGRYWIGVGVLGWSDKKRRTAERALDDAYRQEDEKRALEAQTVRVQVPR